MAKYRLSGSNGDTGNAFLNYIVSDDKEQSILGIVAKCHWYIDSAEVLNTVTNDWEEFDYEALEEKQEIKKRILGGLEVRVSSAVRVLVLQENKYRRSEQFFFSLDVSLDKLLEKYPNIRLCGVGTREFYITLLDKTGDIELEVEYTIQVESFDFDDEFLIN